MSVVAAGLAGGARPEELPQSAWIDFRGDDGSLPRVDFDDVAAGRPEALAKLRGKVVLVGYTGKPPFRTSAPGASRMNPTEIQANAISTALDDFPLRDAGRLLDIALIVALGCWRPASRCACARRSSCRSPSRPPRCSASRRSSPSPAGG